MNDLERIQRIAKNLGIAMRGMGISAGQASASLKVMGDGLAIKNAAGNLSVWNKAPRPTAPYSQWPYDL